MIIRLGFVDPGLRNMAWLIAEYDTVRMQHEIWGWGIHDIVPRNHRGSADKMTTMAILDGCCEWIGIFPYLANCDTVFIELQLTSKLKAVQNALYSRLYPKAHLLTPTSVKRKFDLIRGGHDQNKRAAVNYVLADPDLDPDWKEHFKSYDKKDDLADCYLMMKFIKLAGFEKYCFRDDSSSSSSDSEQHGTPTNDDQTT